MLSAKSLDLLVSDKSEEATNNKQESSECCQQEHKEEETSIATDTLVPCTVNKDTEGTKTRRSDVGTSNEDFESERSETASQKSPQSHFGRCTQRQSIFDRMIARQSKEPTPGATLLEVRGDTMSFQWNPDNNIMMHTIEVE